MPSLQSPAEPRSSEQRPRLVRTSGTDRDLSFFLEKDVVTIGRARDSNDLVLDDGEISRAHAHLRKLPDGQWELEDHSANGSFVDGIKITRALLQTGSAVVFGSGKLSSFCFESGSSSGPRKAPLSKTLRLGGPEPGALPTRLQLILDTHSVRDIPLRPGRMVLGSFPAPGGVTIDSPIVAEKHAELTIADTGSTHIRDLSNGPGTFVNGVKVTDKDLQEGDMIQLGACETHLLLFRDVGMRVRTLGEFDLKKPLIRVGRAAGNDVVLAHPTVSSYHAEIRREGERLELVDLASANGTFVNGKRIERTWLRPHDRIALGAMELGFDGLTLEGGDDGKGVYVYAEKLLKEVRDKDGRTLRLLDDVSIVLQPGEFVGLLGPSGAGKSTLMDAMNGFRPVDGQVRMNERSLYQYPKLLRELIGYLPQDDILHTQLTVRQCLTFSARLRMPADYSALETEQQVEKVLAKLRLTERADKVISSLSGGQRKRVSLGIELLSDPAVLYVDEPTAGQDPATEMQLMQLFRNIANSGSTVVINTHLLGSFSLLDKVAILARGKLVYYGPSADMLAYFGCKRPVEVYYKLAPPGSAREQEEAIAEEWKQKYLASPAHEEYVAQAMTGAHPHGAGTEAGSTELAPTSSLVGQVKTLLSRQLALRMGNISSIGTLLLPPTLLGVLVCFMASGPNQPMTLLITILVAMWFSCSGNVREIVDEWAIYRRERQRSLRIDSYLSAKLVYLIGLSGVQSLLFISILFLGSALNAHFFGAWLLMWMMGVQGGLIGLLISALASNSEKALYAFPLIMIPELLLAGLLIPVHATPPTSAVPGIPGLVMRMSTGDGPRMDGVLANGLSPIMVSRWGLEAFSEMYVHDAISQPLPAGFEKALDAQTAPGTTAAPGPPDATTDYRYALLSSISSTFHPGDVNAAVSMIAKPASQAACQYDFFSERDLQPGNTLPKYIAIETLFAAVMIGALLLAVRRREKKG